MNLKKHVAHQPFSYEVKDATTAVIFIHGILEGPFQFHELATKALEQGMATFGILLPGHGKSAEDFANSNRQQWINYVDKVIKEISQNYPNIILVGHSMGALLSLLVSEKYDCVIGLFAVAIPLSIKVNLKGFTCSLKVLTGHYDKDDEYVLASYRAWSIPQGTWRNYVRWIPRYIDLFYLIYLTKKELPYLKKPMLFIHCGCDEFVRYKTTKILKRKLTNDNYRIEELKKSGHFYYRDRENEKLINTFVLFLNQLKE